MNPRWAARTPYLIQIHSFTKTYAIPGLRLGYITAHASLTAHLRQFLRPWSVSALAVEAGKFLLRNDDELRCTPDLNEAQRLRDKLQQIDSIITQETQTNFILAQFEVGHTAAELIMTRADAEKEHMGLTSWENAPKGKIVKTDVSIAKNYLKGNELESLGRIVNAFLDLAENRAKRHIPMTMEDWAKYIDKFLTMDDRPLLQNNGSVSAEDAKEFAESEFEKYRIIQDRLFKSDFDDEIEGLLSDK